jgi:hypothetical protein
MVAFVVKATARSDPLVTLAFMNSPRPPRKTILTSLTNLIQGGATKVKFSQFKLKPNAKVPEVWVSLASNQLNVYEITSTPFHSIDIYTTITNFQYFPFAFFEIEYITLLEEITANH